jgi:hypothetical protein
MNRYRVFATFSEVKDVIVEANSEDDARDKAYSIDYDEWNLFTADFEGDEVEELN